MGMYTELYLCCTLSNMTQRDINILSYMFNENCRDVEPEKPNHPFFSTDRWSFVGNCSSYYFVPVSFSKFEQDAVYKDNYHLITRSDLKDYDREIYKFIDYIKPFINLNTSDPEHLGHYRYEEDDRPTLIFAFDGDLVFLCPMN